jgi:hypothetical protein
MEEAVASSVEVPGEAPEHEQALQATQESLDQVRDILFGSQLRQQDHRFKAMEDAVAGQLAAFREETRQQLDTLQAFMKTELTALHGRVTGELQQRQEAMQRLGDELRAADRGLSEKIDHTARAVTDEAKGGLHGVANELNAARSALDGRMTAAESQQAASAAELRTLLLDQTRQLRDETKQQQAELQALVEKVVSELKNAKTDRSALAGLFAEMAGKLQG